MNDTAEQIREAEQTHVLHKLLRTATLQRESLAERDSLIREAVRLGVPQTQVANIAGITQASVSRLVKRPRTDRSGRGRRSAAGTGAGGGTL